MEVAAVLLERQADFEKAEVDLVFALDDTHLKRMLINAAVDAQDIHNIGCASVHQGEHKIPVKLRTLGWQVDQSCSGQLPLIGAAKMGRLEQVQALLDMGASVNLLGEQNCSALCWSTRRNHVSVSHLLIEAGAKNLPDTQGNTPLMFAASQGDKQSVKALLERGASPSEQSQSGSHALLLAASAGQLAIVRQLLERSAPVDLKNNVGDTPLILAVRDNQPDVAALLLQHGASARARNDRLESARSLAADKDDQRWMELFENRGSFWTLATRD